MIDEKIFTALPLALLAALPLMQLALMARVARDELSR
jgi:hypothetical protein